MALQLSLGGFLLAAGMELLFLFLLGQVAGSGVAILVAVFAVALIDFFWMRSGAIILGQLLGFLSVTGVWYILVLLKVVH